MMMINGGKFDGKQVIAPAVIKKLSDGGNINAFSSDPDAKGVMGNKDWSYRAQWWVRAHTGKRSLYRNWYTRPMDLS